MRAVRSSDGRVLRGARNRERIVTALLELVGEGSVEPTAEQVAARAGVGTRTVFRHFADMETLFEQLAERLERVMEPLFLEARPEGDLVERTLALLRARCDLFERAAPHERATRFYKVRSPFVRARHAELVRHMGEESAGILAPDLSPADGPVFLALQLTLSFASWDHLRDGLGLAADEVLEVLEHQVRALCGAPQAD